MPIELIQCPICNHQVSPRAATCPGCGHPFLNQGDKTTLTDIEIPFMSIVMLMVQWAVASIPAAIILAFLGFALAAIFGGIFGTR